MRSPDPRLSLPPFEKIEAAERQRVAIQEMAKRELAKRDYPGFVDQFSHLFIAPDEKDFGWAHREIMDILDAFVEAVEKKLSPRLMIFLPPRFGKSVLVSRMFPPFILAKHPRWEVMCATYGQDLADSLGADVRTLMNFGMYQELFPESEVSKLSNAKDELRTTAGGGYKAVGVGGPSGGFGARVLIVDDAIKDREAAESEAIRTATWDWFSAAASTRLAPGGGVIVMNTRWHMMDLPGMILENAATRPGARQWKVYSFPAIAVENEKHRKTGEALHPERFPLEELMAKRSDMIPRDWNALYQQSPVNDEGDIYRAEWIKTFNTKDLPKNLYWYLSTDFAIGEKQTNDWTVVTPIGVDHNDDWWVCEPRRFRGDAHTIIKELHDMAENKKPMYVAVEKGHISKSIGPFMKTDARNRGLYYAIWEHTPSKDKTGRSRSFQGRLAQGRVKFEDTELFRTVLHPELLAFPSGRWDDYADTLSQCALMLEDLMRAPPPKDLPPEPAIPGSWHDLYGEREEAKATKSHRPTSLFAHLKKKKS